MLISLLAEKCYERINQLLQNEKELNKDDKEKLLNDLSNFQMDALICSGMKNYNLGLYYYSNRNPGNAIQVLNLWVLFTV